MQSCLRTEVIEEGQRPARIELLLEEDDGLVSFPHDEGHDPASSRQVTDIISIGSHRNGILLTPIIHAHKIPASCKHLDNFICPFHPLVFIVPSFYKENYAKAAPSCARSPGKPQKCHPPGFKPHCRSVPSSRQVQPAKVYPKPTEEEIKDIQRAYIYHNSKPSKVNVVKARQRVIRLVLALEHIALKKSYSAINVHSHARSLFDEPFLIAPGLVRLGFLGTTFTLVLPVPTQFLTATNQRTP